MSSTIQRNGHSIIQDEKSDAAIALKILVLLGHFHSEEIIGLLM